MNEQGERITHIARVLRVGASSVARAPARVEASAPQDPVR
jgi:hypothetical protein